MPQKLPARYNVIALPLVLSVLMTFIVSGVSTFSGLGFSADVLEKWMRAWGLSWIVAFPTMLVVLPMARRLVMRMVEPPRG